MREYVATAKTVEEAIQLGCEALSVDRDDLGVSYEILEMPQKTGFLGLKVTPAKVKVTVETADTEPETAPDALSEKPSDEILKEDAPQPVKQQSDDGGAYRLTREDSQPQPQTSAQDQPAQDTPAEDAVDAPSRRRRANRKPADAPSEDE